MLLWTVKSSEWEARPEVFQAEFFSAWLLLYSFILSKLMGLAVYGLAMVLWHRTYILETIELGMRVLLNNYNRTYIEAVKT